MSWVPCCKKHFEKVKRDIKKKGWIVEGWGDDADRRNFCDVPRCPNRADYEVFYNKEALSPEAEEKEE